MGKAKDPPPFMMDKPYQQWKTEIKAWMFTADTADKNKAAMTIALSLPEKGCNNIRQRIFNSVTFFTHTGDPPVESVSPEAFKDLIEFMDKEFAKDDISELYDKTDAFLHTVKKADETMKEFINRFDDAMNQADKAGMGEISQGFKMCLFLKNAKIGEKDFKFVISAIDYKMKARLYPQAKESMIKYFGSIGSKPDTEGAEGGVMDLETLWSKGGYRGRGNRGGYRGGYRGGGGNKEDDGEKQLRVESKFAGNIFGNQWQARTQC